MVYGISDDSKYSKVQPADGEMLISDGLRDKYKLKNGDTITLDKEYSSDSYKIKVSRCVHISCGIGSIYECEDISGNVRCRG